MSRRPFSVTLLALVVLFFAAVCLARFVQAVTLWYVLEEFTAIWPGYLVITGLIWFPAGAVLAWGLLYGRPWARRLAPAVFLIFSVNYWIERLVFPGDMRRNENWLFVAVVTVVLSGVCIWICGRPRVKAFFEGRYERKSENQSTS
jgi:hypothetical protein